MKRRTRSVETVFHVSVGSVQSQWFTYVLSSMNLQYSTQTNSAYT